MDYINLYDLLVSLDIDNIISLTFVKDNLFVQKRFKVFDFLDQYSDLIDQIKSMCVCDLYTAVCFDHDKSEYYSVLFIGCNKVFISE